MPELVFAAAWKPAQEDWLNDLSSRPPVSVTMHAVNDGLAAADELGVPLLELPEPLLLHAAVSSASTLSAVTALNVPVTVPPLRGAALLPPDITGLLTRPGRPRHKKRTPQSPPGGTGNLYLSN